MDNRETLDLAIVGAGIGGVIALHYARRAGLAARAFEKQDGVGGLWRQLPAWQDIQIGTHDWALGPLGVAGPYQPDILKNIESWVEHFGLGEDIELGCPVTSARHRDGLWELTTPRGTVRARHLLATSGAHNRPHVPAIQREDVRLREFHSSALRDQTLLAGQRVLVVGGGASALDLLDLAFQQGAASVAWAHRHVRWMIPGRKAKQVTGSLRQFGLAQMSGATPAQIDAAMDADLRSRYRHFGLEAIVPKTPLNLGRQQTLPGRPRMIEHFASIARHEAGVEAVRGHTVVLSDGHALEADLLLWGTGYEIDLSYFDNPRLAAIRRLDELIERCGGPFISLDEPNLYLPAVALDGVGSATWAYALLARSLMAHVQGRLQLTAAPLPRRPNHFDFAFHLAPQDPLHFTEGRWRAEYAALANTPEGEPFPIP